MRVLVFGYHLVGHACLSVLLEEGVEIAAVITHEDDPGETIWFPSVFQLAFDHKIPVRTPGPGDLTTSFFTHWVEDLKPDLIFSFYYRYLIPKNILDIPPMGALNMHGAYLPRYRGRCPVNWVLIHGETETGVTLHEMVEKPDAGDIVGQTRIPISATDTARTLMEKVSSAGADLLRDLLPLIREGRAPRIPQDESRATCFGGRRPEDGEIDWSRSAREIHNLIRAVTHPYPGAFTTSHGKKLLIWKATPLSETTGAAPGEVLSVSPLKVAAGKGGLLLEKIQMEGMEETGGEEFAKIQDLTPGMFLGNPKVE